MSLITLGRRGEAPRAPVWARDAVMVWAREHGSAPADVVWNGVLKCWQVNLALKPDDPRRDAWQRGGCKGPEPVEEVYLHVFREREDGRGYYEPMNLEDLGESGLVNLLDRGSLTTGRGEYRDLMEAVREVRRTDEARREKLKEDQVKDAGLRARDDRRAALGIPVLPVGIDLSESKA